MTKTTRRRTLKAGAWIWSAVLLAVFAVSFVTIRVLAARTAGGYPTPPFLHLFFSDTIHMKAWLATGAIVLALFQALTGGRIFEIVHFAPYGRSWNRIHRIPGYLATLLPSTHFWARRSTAHSSAKLSACARANSPAGHCPSPGLSCSRSGK